MFFTGGNHPDKLISLGNSKHSDVKIFLIDVI